MKIISIQSYSYNKNPLKQTNIRHDSIKASKSDNFSGGFDNQNIYKINRNNNIRFGSSNDICNLYYEFNKPIIPYEHIERWVNQFPPEDRENAIKLAKTIDYLSYSDTFKELQNLHKKLSTQLQKDGFDTETFHDVDFTKAYTCKSGDMISYLYRKANKVRNTCFKTMEGLLANNPDDIENRAVVILDDYTGSGEQFLSDFYARNIPNRELLNKYKKIYFVPLIANSTSIQNFRAISDGKYDEVASRFIKACPLNYTDGDINFALTQIASEKLQMINGKIEYPLFSKENKKLSDTEKEELQKFLLKYNSGYPLGYGNVQGNTAFFFTVPNNTPELLWNTKVQGKGLIPLFQRTDDISIYPMKDAYSPEEYVR